MGPQRCINGCGGWQRRPLCSCGTASANLPPFLAVWLLCARWTTERAVCAVCGIVAHVGVARCIDSLSASGAGQRAVAGARLYNPTVVVDEHLHPTLGADPLRDVLDQRLSIVGVAGGEKNAATDKRYMCDAAC